MSHSLVEIPFSDWPKLLELYSERKKCSSAYSLILNYINWIKNDPEIGAKIYALDGDWESDGTFILINSEQKPLKVYFNTLSETLERLSLALACLDLSKPNYFFAIQERHIPALKEHFIQAGFNEAEMEMEGTVWYNIEREKALAFNTEPPADITLSSLQIKHADMINSVWPHRSDGSVKFVERLIKSNCNIGAYDKDGNLIGWCLRLPVGALGVLQVVETHKRQGIGSLLVRNMSRIIALKDEEVLAPVVFQNVASRSMFEKLGFQGIDNVYWILRPAK